MQRECRLFPHLDPRLIREAVLFGTARATAEMLGLRNGDVTDPETFLRSCVALDGIMQDPETGADVETGPSQLNSVVAQIQQEYAAQEVAQRDPYRDYSHLGNPQQFPENGTAPEDPRDPQGYGRRAEARARQIAAEARYLNGDDTPDQTDQDERREYQNAQLEYEMHEQDQALASLSEDDMESVLAAESENAAMFGDAAGL
jgi:hypothetical protein